MSKADILLQLPKLTSEERDEIRLKLVEIDHTSWLEVDDPLTSAERAILEERLLRYRNDPEPGSSWEEVEGRIRARLKK